MPKKTEKSIEELLDIAYQSEDPVEVKKITKKILEQDPNHPEALFLLADTSETPEEALLLLERAHGIAYKNFGLLGVAPEDALDSDEGEIYTAIVQRMIIPLIDCGRVDDALKFSERLRALDPENQVETHSLYYYALLKKKNFAAVLEQTMKEEVHTLAWAWARFIAVFRLSGQAAEKNFWEALAMSPDVPFYMFGKFEEPVSDDEVDAEDFAFALLFAEHITGNADELTAFVMARVMLFGVLSDRITMEDRDEYDTAIEILTASGLIPIYNKLAFECKNQDDDTIIEKIRC